MNRRGNISDIYEKVQCKKSYRSGVQIIIRLVHHVRECTFFNKLDREIQCIDPQFNQTNVKYQLRAFGN